MKSFFHEANALMDQGGFVLWIILGLSIVLYTILATSWLEVFHVRQEIGQLETELTTIPSSDLLRDRVEIFELEHLAWIQRRLPVLSVLIALAPLAGLLGTVTGILNTFAGMASEHTIKPLDSISSGISEALITTQAGILVAIPAAILFALLKSRFQQLSGRLEQCSTQQSVSHALASIT